jgi:uncharacterized repeat protein (TIGR01451 family)
LLVALSLASLAWLAASDLQPAHAQATAGQRPPASPKQPPRFGKPGTAPATAPAKPQAPAPTPAAEPALDDPAAAPPSLTDGQAEVPAPTPAESVAVPAESAPSLLTDIPAQPGATEINTPADTLHQPGTEAEALPNASAPVPTLADGPAADPTAPQDDQVVPVQGTPGTAGAAPRPAGAPGAPFMIAPESLPLGPQSVALAVQVFAPATMQLNKEHTVTIVVKNSSSQDAQNVVVRDQLPEGVQFVSANPETGAPAGGILTWNLDVVPAGSEKALKLVVRPTAKGTQDHAATVQVVTGSRARSTVLQPELRVELSINRTQILKGQQVPVDITVTNTGDGPARDILIQAELSEGLTHRQLGRILELDIKELGPRQTVKLDPLVIEAVSGGEQTITLAVASPDVATPGPEAKAARTIVVTEPLLKLELTGSPVRYTDSDAEYTLTVTNPGTAPAQDVRVSATLVGDGRPYTPSGAAWDPTNRRINWNLGQIEPGAAPRSFTIRVRLGGLGIFKVDAEAIGRGGLRDIKSCSTSVEASSDLDLSVSEDLRVLDIGQETIFRIRIRNLGTKEAREVQVGAVLSKLEALETQGTDQNAKVDKATRTQIQFPIIPRIGPGSEIQLAVRARAKGAGLSTCRVYVSHADLKADGGARLEEVANVNVTTATAAPPANPVR